MRPASATLLALTVLLVAGCTGSGGNSSSPSPSPSAATCSEAGFKAGNVYVNVTTNLGKMVWELRGDKAPITTCNILRYVNEKFYDNTCFHRVIKGFVDQGGGMDKNSCGTAEKPTHDPIVLETGGHLRNYEMTLAMARTGVPDSATSQFFINVANNSKGHTYDLDFDGRQAPGYAVFGKVVEGYDVAKKIESTPVDASDKPTTSVYITSATVNTSR